MIYYNIWPLVIYRLKKKIKMLQSLCW